MFKEKGKELNILRPVASSVEIKNLSTNLELGFDGQPREHGILRAIYTYEKGDIGGEGETEFQWYNADEKEGSYTPIMGIRTQQIILIKDYLGKYLKCKITPVDVKGVRGNSVFTEPTVVAVQEMEGNPLTDWMGNQYGVSSHFIDHVFNLEVNGVYWYELEDRWQYGISWNNYLAAFNVNKYVDQLEQIGAAYWMLTMGQNDGYFIAPSKTYDKYMRVAGLLGINEVNPMTPEFDLPQLIQDEIKRRGLNIKMMLYLPVNPPFRASVASEAINQNGLTAIMNEGSNQITTDVFYHPVNTDNPHPNTEIQQKSRKRWETMVEEWSLRYGEDLAGWWFDGFYNEAEVTLKDMSRKYNISSFTNAAKAGNPYAVVTYNPGINVAYNITSIYSDFNGGETPDMQLPNEQIDRWVIDGIRQGINAQIFTWVALGDPQGTIYAYGRPGLGYSDEYIISGVKTSFGYNGALCFDLNLDHKGNFDDQQVEQLIKVKNAIELEFDSKIE